MSGPTLSPISTVAAAPALPATPAAAPQAPHLATDPAPAAGDTAAAVPQRGKAPTPDIDGGVDWGRLGIAAGLAPVAYAAGITLHEAVGHGAVAAALGATDVSVQPFPHTYTRSDGSTGFRFAAMSYRPPDDWGEAEYAAVYLGPSAVDATLIAAGTLLYETGHWPENPWASGALFALQAAATVDLAYNGMNGLLQADNEGVDTVRAARSLGVSPYLIGGLQVGVAAAGAAELVRIGLDVFSRKSPAQSDGPSLNLSASPVAGGGVVGVSGRF